MYMQMHMKMCMCTVRDPESGLSKTRVSGPERWWAQREKRKVRRELGGGAILTCKSLEILWRKEAKDEPNHPVADSIRSVPQESWS